VLVDGISKAFAATGLRVGWAVGPTDVIARMSALLGHMGAWAPRPEQVASAALLSDHRAIRDFQDRYRPAVQSRLDRLHRGLTAIGAGGQPVQSLPPAGAIYLTARIHPFGRHTPEGQALATNEDVRRYLLEAAGVAVIPFQAFGTEGDTGWFRFSVGAVEETEIDAALERLATALQALGPGAG
jgi:aspartate aminotransferase